MTHCVLRQHERTETIHDVIALDREIHQLDRTNGIRVEDNALSRAEVCLTVANAAAAERIVLDARSIVDIGRAGFGGRRDVV